MLIDNWKKKLINENNRGEFSSKKSGIIKISGAIYMLIMLFVSIVFFACTDKYLAFKNQYQFKSKDGKPDYSDLQYWAAHPWKWDPSDSVPLPMINEKRDSAVDVFFIHPTMYTMKMKENKMNADIDDDYLNSKTDYSTILYQASVFNQHARVFAPRYREAHLSAYITQDTAAGRQAFDIAYDDVKAAFEYYLLHYNHGRPIIIASHSQGSTHAQRLLKEFFENRPLQQQLVAAYVVGMAIPKEYFSSLKMCEDSLQTGCICGWRTFRKGYKPPYVTKENGNSFVTNPLTWTTDSTYASRKINQGSVLYKFNKVYKHTTDAKIDRDVLWVRKPKFPWGIFYSTRIYHTGDINLFYLNIKENIGQRIQNYFKNQSLK